MLPIEAFADVASFLEYYELGGLKLADGLTSAVADQCASAIRVFDFSEFAFYMWANCIYVTRLRSDGYVSVVCDIGLTSNTDMAEFVSEAFRNCIVGRFGFKNWRCDHILNAIEDVAKTIIVDESLDVTGRFENMHDLERYVGSYRLVKV